ncbi:Uncharacterised protein [uncultured archaeon]|nr:Uncharacterised protein [uncultured archaeon]
MTAKEKRREKVTSLSRPAKSSDTPLIAVARSCDKAIVKRHLDYLEKLEHAGVEIKPRYTLSNPNEIAPTQFQFSHRGSSRRCK